MSAGFSWGNIHWIKSVREIVIQAFFSPTPSMRHRQTGHQAKLQSLTTQRWCMHSQCSTRSSAHPHACSRNRTRLWTRHVRIGISESCHDCTLLKELLDGRCTFSGYLVRLGVGQGTGGGWKAFSVVDVLEPEPTRSAREGRLDMEIIRRGDGTRMSCWGGSLIGKFQQCWQ